MSGGRDLHSLPKVDLHVHLEGAVRPRTLAEIATRHGAGLPPGLENDAYRFTSFLDFISQYFLVCAALQEMDDFRRIGVEFCEDAASQGTRYAEVTFTIASHALRLGGDWSSPMAAVLDGFREGEERFGVTARLVLDHARGLPVEICEQTVDVALAFADRGVVAVGLGGDEARPPEPYAAAFRRAIDGGLHSVPHAGEANGPVSIRGALDALGAERLGHGFRVLEDEDLVAEVRERRIPLEVCPTSNVATGLVASLAEHPLPLLRTAGLVVTVNSDDPAMFASPLLGEYEACRTAFAMADDEIAALAAAGVDASFAPPALKAEMAAGIDGWLGRPPS